MTEINGLSMNGSENNYLNVWVFPRGMKREGTAAITALVEAP